MTWRVAELEKILQWRILREPAKGFMQFVVLLTEALSRSGNLDVHFCAHSFLFLYWVVNFDLVPDFFNACYSENCGVLAAIALADMHECEAEPKKAVKRFKGLNGKRNIVEGCNSDQPRSPFRFFMFVSQLSTSYVKMTTIILIYSFICS